MTVEAVHENYRNNKHRRRQSDAGCSQKAIGQEL
jgi:hypothetical protein